MEKKKYAAILVLFIGIVFMALIGMNRVETACRIAGGELKQNCSIDVLSHKDICSPICIMNISQPPVAFIISPINQTNYTIISPSAGAGGGGGSSDILCAYGRCIYGVGDYGEPQGKE